MKYRFIIWVMLPRKLERPRRIGDRSRIRDTFTSSSKLSLAAKPGKKNFVRYGIAKNIATHTTITSKKKIEHLLKSIPYKAATVSVVQPPFYAHRFFKFIAALTETSP